MYGTGSAGGQLTMGIIGCLPDNVQQVPSFCATLTSSVLRQCLSKCTYLTPIFIPVLFCLSLSLMSSVSATLQTIVVLTISIFPYDFYALQILSLILIIPQTI